MNYKKNPVLLKNYKLLQTIGKGRNSDVLLALNIDNRKHYAVKIFRKRDMIQKNNIKRISWELRILSNQEGHFFPEFHGTAQTDSEFFIFMEFIPGGDFYYWETNIDNMSIISGQFYIGQMILILKSLHSQGIIYRDLKPENIMLGADGYVKLIDFGSSIMLQTITDRTFSLCGTPEFLSPEVLLKKGHNIAVDYWALGVLIYEIFTKKGPFFDEDPMRLYVKTIKIEYKFPDNFPERVKSIVKGLLVRIPKHRLGMMNNGIEDLMNNELFKDFNWSDLINRKICPPIIPKVRDDRDISNFRIHKRLQEDLETVESKYDPFLLW